MVLRTPADGRVQNFPFLGTENATVSHFRAARVQKNMFLKMGTRFFTRCVLKMEGDVQKESCCLLLLDQAAATESHPIIGTSGSALPKKCQNVPTRLNSYGVFRGRSQTRGYNIQNNTKNSM